MILVITIQRERRVFSSCGISRFVAADAFRIKTKAGRQIVNGFVTEAGVQQRSAVSGLRCESEPVHAFVKIHRYAPPEKIRFSRNDLRIDVSACSQRDKTSVYSGACLLAQRRKCEPVFHIRQRIAVEFRIQFVFEACVQTVKKSFFINNTFAFILFFQCCQDRLPFRTVTEHLPQIEAEIFRRVDMIDETAHLHIVRSVRIVNDSCIFKHSVVQTADRERKDLDLFFHFSRAGKHLRGARICHSKLRSVSPGPQTSRNS